MSEEREELVSSVCAEVRDCLNSITTTDHSPDQIDDLIGECGERVADLLIDQDSEVEGDSIVFQVAGVISTFPPFSSQHPSTVVPIAQAIRDAGYLIIAPPEEEDR